MIMLVELLNLTGILIEANINVEGQSDMLLVCVDNVIRWRNTVTKQRVAYFSMQFKSIGRIAMVAV